MPAKIPAHIREQQINTLPNITFVHWDGEYRGARSKAVVRCTVDGHEWSARVSNLLDQGTGCPECSRKTGVDKQRIHAHVREQEINELTGITFIRWDGEYRNNLSKAIVSCAEDHKWSASVSSLVNKKHGCPECAADKKRKPCCERVAQINELPNVIFVRWEDEYTNCYSKAICRCSVGHEWCASVSNLLDQGTGCPQCVTSGYNPSKPGTLYALRSECGTMVKIGISNNYERRHRELTKATPFSWDCTELLHGDGALIASLEKALHGMTEPVEFTEPFHGYTEWRKWTPELVDWFNTWREMT